MQKEQLQSGVDSGQQQHQKENEISSQSHLQWKISADREHNTLHGS